MSECASSANRISQIQLPEPPLCQQRLNKKEVGLSISESKELDKVDKAVLKQAHFGLTTLFLEGVKHDQEFASMRYGILSALAMPFLVIAGVFTALCWSSGQFLQRICEVLSCNNVCEEKYFPSYGRKPIVFIFQPSSGRL